MLYAVLESRPEFLIILPSAMLPVTENTLGLPDKSEEISEGSIYAKVFRDAANAKELATILITLIYIPENRVWPCQ